jgi:hypothetical protein
MRILQLFTDFKLEIVLVVIFIAIMIVGFLGGMWWKEERYHSPSCMIFRPEITLWEEVRGILELSLKNQNPVDRTVESELFLRLEKPPIPPPSDVQVTRSAVRGYAPAKIAVSFIKDGEALQSADWEKFDLLSRHGLHKDFPFDSRSFGFTLGFSTELPLDVLKLTNRISGFYIPCSEGSVTWESPRTLKVRFHLQRNRLTQLYAIVFLIIAVIFGYIIVFFINDTQALATAVASYFLSLWSLERILQDEMHIFPTIFDAALMMISLMMLLGVIGGVVGTRFQRKSENSSRGSDGPPYG